MGVRSGAVQSGGTVVGPDARHEGAQARPKLLVVEDDPNIVELLSASLRFAGFDVSAVTGLNGFSDVTVTNTPEGHAYIHFGVQLIAVANASGQIDATDFIF